MSDNQVSFVSGSASPVAGRANFYSFFLNVGPASSRFYVIIIQAESYHETL